MHENKAINIIGFLENLLNVNPSALSLEDLVGHEKKLRGACSTIKDEDYRQRGLEALKRIKQHLQSF